jgi:hypothetical protein
LIKGFLSAFFFALDSAICAFGFGKFALKLGVVVQVRKFLPRCQGKADGDEDCLEDLLTEYTLMKDFSHLNVAKTFEAGLTSTFPEVSPVPKLTG